MEETISGANRILNERVRQINKEGYSYEHDDEHIDGEIAMAAAAYTIPEPKFWPWRDSEWKPSGDRIKDLTKAGALIAAEIDRLLRKQNG